MSERKLLKKKLRRLKQARSQLPILIDCSEVYGDNYFTTKTLDDINKDIEYLEKQLNETKQ